MQTPGSGRSPGGGNGNLLLYSCLGNSMDRGAWWATVPGVAKSQTQLSDYARMHANAGTWVQLLGQEDPLEKEMATHSYILAREIPWTEEPSGLQSMGLWKSQTWLSKSTTTCPDPASLSIDPKETCTWTQGVVNISRSRIAKTWKQPKCSSLKQMN